MKVIEEEDHGVFLLFPEDDWEGVNNLIAFSKVGIGGMLPYGGRMSEKESGFFSIKFKILGEELIVKGSTLEDKLNIAKIRSLCFHGTLERMILHGFTLTDYGIGLVITASYCENCGRPICERAEWNICRDCAEKLCLHKVYEPMMISDDRGVFLCRICVKCGLPDPIDFLRARGLSEEERIKEIQRMNPNTTFTEKLDPHSIPLAIAVALRGNN